MAISHVTLGHNADLSVAVQLSAFVWRRRGHLDVRALPNVRFTLIIPFRPDTPIPLSVFEKWYTNFNRKIENDRGAAFLDRKD